VTSRPLMLTPQTIVAPALYVERGADRQLMQIIDDMGRPGYVLVARQMGKTNLLLHAKRTLQNASDCFVYVDVSNALPDILSFLRSIIDIALEGSPFALGEVASSIKAARAASDGLLPHKEHELELRAVLRAIPGRLIICLDEVDALSRTEYSDQVFSLIRSTYFSGRVNFKEFGRLTYILSGVAEPSELIKNKAISPFNIGAKIFLDDFSIEEVAEFLQRAQISLSEAARERLYYWSGGNPRITWDIAAALEAERAAGRDIDSATVDAVVSRLYLASFDLPPIDHIRAIAAADRDIRQALMAIHYGKADAVSDVVRKKLYLAGITKVAESGATATLKNRIVGEALSEKWLNEAEKGAVPPLEAARRFAEQKQYQEAIEQFHIHLERGDDPNPEYTYFELGKCLFESGRYEEAAAALQNASVRKVTSTSLYFKRAALLGSALLLSGKFSESADWFRTVLDEAPKFADPHLPSEYFQSCVNLGSAYLHLDEAHVRKAIDVCREVTEKEDEVRAVAKGALAAQIMYLAYYNASKGHRALNEAGQALAAIDKAIEHAPDEPRAALLVKKAQMTGDLTEKTAILRQCIQYCYDRKISVTADKSPEKLAFSLDACSELVLELGKSGSREDLAKALAYISQDAGAEKHVSLVLWKACAAALNSSEGEAVRALFDVGPQWLGASTSDPARRLFLAYAALMKGEPFREMYVRDYFERTNSPLLPIDYRLLFDRVLSLIDSNSHISAQSTLRSVREVMAGSEHADHESASTLLDYLDAISELTSGTSTLNAERLAELRRRIAKMPAKPVLDFFPATFREDLLVSLRPSTVLRAPTTVVVGRKIGRNELVVVRMRDGTIKTDKYKRVEHLVRKGEAQVVEDNDVH
jgi:tetratricopeptide (TPR) repeat protein